MQNDAKQSSQDSVRQLGRLIEGFRSAVLVSQKNDGSFHARPMATQQLDFEGDLWFFTSATSHKIEELHHSGTVCVCYSEPKDNRFVSVYGTAEILQDDAKARELWNPLYKTWFPKGLDDPDLRLIRVRVESAEYWDAPSSSMMYLVGFAKAMATGQRFDASRQYGQVNLPH